MSKINLRQHLKNAIFGGLFAVLGIFGLATSPLLTTPVYAEPESSESTSVSENNDDTETCYDQVPGIGWLVCPTTGALGKAVDAIARQPEAAGKINSSLMFGLIMMETTAVYALLVAILLIFVLGAA